MRTNFLVATSNWGPLNLRVRYSRTEAVASVTFSRKLKEDDAKTNKMCSVLSNVS